jgi:adenosylhomocysteinase
MSDTHKTQTELAKLGESRLRWIRSRMHMLANVRERFQKEQPFAGLSIGVGLHTEPKTAVLLETLAAGGARVFGTGNHGSTQDDTVAALKTKGIIIYGKRDDTWDKHMKNVERTVDLQPDILLDNGADLIATALQKGMAGKILGATEETTSGGYRLRETFGDKVSFPVIVINDSPLKAIGENEHGVGQSGVESLMRMTNLHIPGRRFVVVGYGWCGKGVARYLKALGGKVGVVDIDPLKSFEAVFEGYKVGSMEELLPWADIVITVTGRSHALAGEYLNLLQDGVVLANLGHFPFEIDVEALKAEAINIQEMTDSVVEYTMPDGRRLTVLADGRMFNLAGLNPKGNSIEAMDLGFTLQALSLERIATAAKTLPAGPQRPPLDIEHRIAKAFLKELNATK